MPLALRDSDGEPLLDSNGEPLIDSLPPFDGEADEDISGLAEAAERVLVSDRQIAESAPATDTLDFSTAYAFLNRFANENVSGVDDDVERIMTYERDIPEDGPAVYSLADVRLFIRTASNNISGLSDAWSAAQLFVQAISESAPASESLGHAMKRVRSIQEVLTTSASFGALRLYARNLAQTTSTSDAWTQMVVFIRPTAETASASESLARAMTMARSIAESGPASPSFTDHRIFPRTATESPQFTGADFSHQMKHIRAVAESVAGLSASFTRLLVQPRYVIDSVPPATNDVERMVRFVVDLEEDVEPTDDFDGLLLTATTAPTVTIQDISAVRLDEETNRYVVTVDFTFDWPVDAWSARIQSTDETNGRVLDSYEGPVTLEGSAVIPVSAPLNDDTSLLVYGGQVETAWTHSLKIYGHTVNDLWSDGTFVEQVDN